MAKKVQVQSGCRDCTKCMNSAVNNLGRNTGRATLGILTVGMSEIAMAGTKNCRVCGHKFSLHTGEAITPPASPMARTVANVTRTRALFEKSKDKAEAKQDDEAQNAVSVNPARWVEQANGEYRWWTGDHWSDEFTTDPKSPDPALLPVVDVPVEQSASLIATATAPDVVAKLKELAELRDAGILTDNEFTAAKEQVLGL